jgi:hypothetical protein
MRPEQSEEVGKAMIKTDWRSGFEAADARHAARLIAPRAAQLQGTGLPISATGTAGFGGVARLRGQGATAEHDSAPPV